MGKRIRVQRRGRGGTAFRAHTFGRIAPSALPAISVSEFESTVSGRVLDLVHEGGRGAPLAVIHYADGKVCSIAAPEGLAVGQTVARGSGSTPAIGNILPLGRLPEGTMVCNVELKQGDGGKLARASGAHVMVVAHTPAGTQVRLPSGKAVYLDDRCRAMIGVVGGAGRTEKPFMKAGSRRVLMLSRGRLWPITKGQAMVSASHPYGGGRHKHAGKPTTVSRSTPPGRKVGLIAARRTGRHR